MSWRCGTYALNRQAFADFAVALNGLANCQNFRHGRHAYVAHERIQWHASDWLAMLCPMNQSASPPPQPASHHDDEHPDLSALNARSGLWLFAVYFAAYAVYIDLAVAWPDTMAWVTPLGINLAVTYGIGLILGAVLLALVYMWVCKRNADHVAGGGSQ